MHLLQNIPTEYILFGKVYLIIFINSFFAMAAQMQQLPVSNLVKKEILNC